MKKIFSFLLLLSLFLYSCNNAANAPVSAPVNNKIDKEASSPVSEATATVQDTLQEETLIEEPEIIGSKVYRVTQKIVSSGQGYHSIPLILLENNDILSNEDDILYLLKPGDSVYYSSDGEVIEVIYANKKPKGCS